jgi:hypothetical protein
MTVNKDIFQAKTLKAKFIFAWEGVKFWFEIRAQKLAYKLNGKKDV